MLMYYCEFSYGVPTHVAVVGCSVSYYNIPFWMPSNGLSVKVLPFDRASFHCWQCSRMFRAIRRRVALITLMTRLPRVPFMHCLDQEHNHSCRLGMHACVSHCLGRSVPGKTWSRHGRPHILQKICTCSSCSICVTQNNFPESSFYFLSRDPRH